ncbi:SGNH/GDSL hydrolase family protein [Pseudogracilibacillus auburnensis]|uniref:SGNH/GDSL hydrolase family protein n=1 Tax=Pseudogracilibacillus auburnensis TaxID=1494959 RepID=UPI00131430BC|nr:SGNH/GDSL hydrolase family protein [Pseudogracilibacillus auburnensis]MBO1002121.1 SGNH/GDSL hydrolase family protein [Pseudogracilibacillus auburnensis]
MIHIKRLTIITFILITGLILTIFFIKKADIPTNPMEEILKQEEVNMEKDLENEGEQEKEVVAVREDPVKEFLSEKLKKAVSFFFTQEIKVVTLGDSLTEGIGDETNNGGYVGILNDTINAEKHIVQFQNFAKRGSRSGQLLNRIEDEEVTVALEDADIILITIGANDIMQVFKENFTDLTLDKFTQEQIRYEQRLEMIFNELRDINEHGDIYLIGFYNPFKEYFADIEELEFIVDSWNQIGSDVTMRYDNVHYIPIKDMFDDPPVNYYSEDNFHPNHLGYKMIAERVLHYVMNEGERNATNE